MDDFDDRPRRKVDPKPEKVTEKVAAPAKISDKVALKKGGVTRIVHLSDVARWKSEGWE